MLDEADIIGRLQSAFAASIPGLVGIGDDAAVLPLNERESYVISKDILVENRHFRLSYGDAASLAHKALHVNLSDIAAMGAKPLHVLLGIALPPTLANEWVDGFLTGFAEACRRQNVHLIGGDTTASEGDLFISVTVIGRAAKAHLKFRHGARAGDIICLIGAVGEAQAGLLGLEKNQEGLDEVKAKSLRPEASVAAGLWLGSQAGVTAMMDVSDGLYVDLGRLLQSSKRGATVDLESLKPSALLAEACEKLQLDARECMLAGGEDYALLVTVDAAAWDAVARAFAQNFGDRLTPIGVITASGGLELREGGKTIPFAYRAFSHFGEL